MQETGKSVVVIGAGIIGAAVAYNLQRAGARVTVVDAGVGRATDASFGWINASFHHDDAHFHLRNKGIAAWHRLSEQMSLPIRWQGALCWEETGDAFDAQRDHLSAFGYEVREIERDQFAALEPHVATPPERALHFPTEGAVESAGAVERVMQAAVDAGARRLQGLKVQSLVETGGRITGVRTEAGVTRADEVVIAAGTGSANLMAEVGFALPMLHRPAVMLRTRPVAQMLNHILVSEFGELRQLPDGSLLMPAAPNHQGDASDSLSDTLEETGEHVLARLRTMLPEADLAWQDLSLAFRPVPKDGLPVVGEVMEGLHVACMHSGITLSALAGELVAQEVLEGVSNRSGALLAPYRPGRFGESRDQKGRADPERPALIRF